MNDIEHRQVKNIEHNPYCIRDMDNPCEQAQLAAVTGNASNIHSLKFIQDPSPFLVRLSVQRWGPSILHVDNQTEELCWIALTQDPHSIFSIKTPTAEMIAYARMM